MSDNNNASFSEESLNLSYIEIEAVINKADGRYCYIYISRISNYYIFISKQSQNYKAVIFENQRLSFKRRVRKHFYIKRLFKKSYRRVNFFLVWFSVTLKETEIGGGSTVSTQNGL